MEVIDYALIAVRAVLAGTFLLAGAAKLSSRRSLDALRDFGIPRVAQPLIPLLPWAELLVAAGLLFALTAEYAACGALALLTIFIVGIAANLVRGRRPPCNCFGQVRSKPISPMTLVRNGALAAGAGWLIAIGPPQPDADLLALLKGLDTHGRMLATMIGVVSVIALMFLVRDQEEDSTPLAELDMPTFDEMLGKAPPAAAPAAAAPEAAPRRGRVAPEVKYAAPGIVLNGDGLPAGMAAPTFELPDIEGRTHSMASLLADGKPVLFIFTSPRCEACQALAPKLPALAAQHADAFRLVLVSRGTAQENLAKIKEPGPLLVLLQKEYEVAESFNSTTSPAAVMVGISGAIESRLATGGAAVMEMIAAGGRW